MKSLNSEVTHALTPIILTSTGGLIALVLIISAIRAPTQPAIKVTKGHLEFSKAPTVRLYYQSSSEQ